MTFGHWRIRAHFYALRIIKLSKFSRDVFWDINDNRAWAATGSASSSAPVRSTVSMQLEQVRIDLLGSQQQAIGNLQRYQALFNNAAEGIVRCTREGAILEANPSFMRLLGRTTRQASLA